MPTERPDEDLSSTQAAAHLRVSDKTLGRWRDTNKGPTYSRSKDGRAIYKRSDLDAWRATQFIATIIYSPIEVRERMPVAA